MGIIMYAVVAAGFSGVYINWRDVERIKSLYPYPKWVKVNTEEEANNWIKRNKYGSAFHGFYNYGNTFKTMYIDAQYKILDENLYYVLDCKRLGKLRLNAPNALVEYKGYQIFVKVPNTNLSNESIAAHLSVIYNLLNLVGPNVDINIDIQYYAIFYALVSYTKGDINSIDIVQTLIRDRIGEVALTLKMDSDE